MDRARDQRSGATVERVLLVDDNPTNLQILHRTLERSGYDLLSAGDGRTALELARRYRPSLVLLDIMMPDMDGYAVCRQLKSDPVTAGIAVIFLSALEDSGAKVKGFSVGGVDFISKPFRSDEVVARVRTHIKIHRLEQELARRNNELEAENQQLLNAISEGIVGLDPDGRVTMLNPAASSITGWSAPDALGEKLFQLGLFDVGPEGGVREDQTTPYRAYAQGRHSQSEMELIRRRNGELLQVAMACAPRPGGGAVLVLRDISEWVASEDNLRLAREELESQRQHLAHIERLSTTGEMAAGIAHEVNQPLTAVANYARAARQMLKRDDIDRQRLADILQKMDTQVVRASEVIQRVRSYVKKPSTGREAFDLNVLIQEVIALAEVDSRINDISVDLESRGDLPLVYGDAVQIQQVALNLIRNAMEAMAELPASAERVVVTTEASGDRVCFRVIDRGPGLTPEAEARLFQPFFTTKPSGMGIGLSVCQSIVHAHGGDIRAYRNPEGGMVFDCWLPAAGEKAEKAVPRQELPGTATERTR